MAVSTRTQEYHRAMSMSDPLIARLRRLDSCAVSDACDQLGVTDRVTTALRPMGSSGSVPVAGRVITVLLGPPPLAEQQSTGGGADEVSGDLSGRAPSGDGVGSGRRHLCAAATGSAGSDDVIVVAHQGRGDCAGWGGNLSRAARARGVSGTLVDGAVRDVDEASAIGYTVFATGSTPRTARGRAVEEAWGQPVMIDGISIDQGDYVIADASGVVLIEAARIETVVATAESIAATEAKMAAAIDGGAPVAAVLGADYETMLE